MPARGLQLGDVAFRPIPDRHARRRFHEGPVLIRPENPVGPMFSAVAGTATHLAERTAGRRAAWPAVSVVTHTVVIGLVLFVLPLTGAAIRPAVPEPFPYIQVGVRMPPPSPPPPDVAVEEVVPEEPASEAVEPEFLDEVRSAVAPTPPRLASAPIVAGAGIRPESGLVPGRPASVGGARRGSARGVPGDVVAGLPEAPPPPVRVGGPIPTPALLLRVEPTYPNAAKLVGLQGVVILEATVDEHGRVTAASVLRSGTNLLDQAALEAVRQWRYEPLLFHGQPHPFQLTVTISFSLER